MEIRELIGKTITHAAMYNAEDFGYDEFEPRAIGITLDNDVTLGILRDQEGNGPGVMVWTKQDGAGGMFV